MYDITARTMKRELAWLVIANGRLKAAFNTNDDASEFCALMHAKNRDVDYSVEFNKS